ncbi:hypothetical protein [Caenimonas soli]|jgi:ElaB/YqjD/DUF883 family membrane-anchored ribosome-binding protein|uniref:hypothetical protein n=1 Tax=Caenimonas soli TaxID=2735555 RepID=UPI0015563BA2|nr:hypothetical protein [Caenimonas soli]NPC57130.1 hypothetical protein [Caenimonas soli]
MKSLRAASSYEDEARSATAQALESTKEFANQALEKAGERVRDLRYGVKDLANKGVNSMGEYAHATTRYVAEQPVKSALIAAAVGAAVAALVLAMRRNSSKRYY